LRFACRGECPKNRFIETPDGEPGLNYLCAGFKYFFGHADFAMKLMAGLVQRGRPATEVMAILDRAFDGVGRNDPCPCNSRRKLKQCHGRTHVARRRELGRDILPVPRGRAALTR
jgi:uncharacterized protein